MTHTTESQVQPEALRIASKLEDVFSDAWKGDAAAELRRQHEVITELVAERDTQAADIKFLEQCARKAIDERDALAALQCTDELPELPEPDKLTANCAVPWHSDEAIQTYARQAQAMAITKERAKLDDALFLLNTQNALIAAANIALELKERAKVVPLTNEQAMDLLPTNTSMPRTDALLWVIRATERAHGITGEPK